MKERKSLQEQLAEVVRSERVQKGLYRPLALSTQLTIPNKTSANPLSSTPYENLILEIERLRTENKRLSGELDSHKSSNNAESIQQQGHDTKIFVRLQAAIDSETALLQENQRLKQELVERPSKAEVLKLQERMLKASAHMEEATRSATQVELERRQIIRDRAAFELELSRLEMLDAMDAKLAKDQQKISEDQKKLQGRFNEIDQMEKKLASKREKLEKWASELHQLRSKVGHLKGIEGRLTALEQDYAKVSRLYEASKTRIRNLTIEKTLAQEGHSAAEANAKLAGRELKETLKKLSLLPEGEVVIRSFETVQWLVGQFSDPHQRLVPKKVLLIGDGPWRTDDLTEVLQELGFEVWHGGCNAEVEVVIVGRQNWSATAVEAQIEVRDKQSLRIYPQELFVLLLAMQSDPLEVAEPEALIRFVKDHPVFEYLFSLEFPWPETTFEDGPPTTIGQGFDGEDASSPLYKMGYSVAQQIALSTPQRHNILLKAYAKENLPWCISDEYMADWGQGNSRGRLRRIAWHLHLMTKRFRRHTEAVSRWESDLDWLRQTQYKSIHRFRWPS